MNWSTSPLKYGYLSIFKSNEGIVISIGIVLLGLTKIAGLVVWINEDIMIETMKRLQTFMKQRIT
jgi:hypothetical protein